MHSHYILEGKIPVLEPDLLTWARWMEDPASSETLSRRVALDQLGQIEISTVFLGIDHQWREGPPILFETMVFENGEAGDCARYSTWEEAEDGHREIVERIRASIDLPAL
jgi:hypothetical protein